jgi:filamentous hemagglutinin family protein
MKNVRQIIVTAFLAVITALPVYGDGTHPKGIRLDGSVGSAGALDLPGPDYDIRAEYGHQSGSNLFHSFHRFNIHSDESATFTGPDSVQNIISRVTGGEASWIDGRLASAIPGADLYMLNPSGMMFGPNASLDLSGSFHVSTAGYLRLGENDRFYSTPHANDVLSVSAPAAFGFLDDSISKISVQGRGEITEQEAKESPAGLSVAEGKTISLVGGDIEITKGTYYQVRQTDENGSPVLDENGNPVTETEYQPNLSAPAGRINLASVSSQGEVVPSDSDLRVSSARKGDISLSDKALVDADGKGGGSVYVQSGRLAADSSTVSAKTTGADKGGVVDIQADAVFLDNGASVNASTSGTGKGGTISVNADVLNASGKEGEGGIWANSYGEESGAGDAGTVDIRAGEINLTQSAQISSETWGAGKGGTISVTADVLNASGIEDGYPSGIFAGSYYGTGDGGTVDIQAREINLTAAAEIGNGTFGSGKGGSISVTADVLNASGIEEGYFTGIFAGSYSEEFGSGDGGTVDIQAGEINLTESAQISSATSGSGKGGSISVTADVLNAGYSSIFTNSYSEESGAGDAGTIDIQARGINLTESAQIASFTWGSGKGGSIFVKADFFNASGIEDGYPSGIVAGSYSGESGAGDAGIIDVQAGEINLTEAAQITNYTSGSGKGGNVFVKADVLNASGIEDGYPSGIIAGSYSWESGAGDAGTLDIQAGEINLTAAAEIANGTFGSGKGGSIFVRADVLNASGIEEGYSSGIFAGSYSEESGAGDAGILDIQAGEINLTEASRISSATSGSGKGGSISVKADFLNARYSSILASSYSEESGAGDAGTVDIQAGEINLTEAAQIASFTWGTGKGGTIFVKAYVLNASGIEDGSPSGIVAGSYSEESGAGDAGTVDIQAGGINLTGAAQITSTTYGSGKGGSILVKADVLNASGIEDGYPSGIFAGSYGEESGAGDAGTVDIRAGETNLTEAAQIETLTKGPGKAGNIALEVSSLEMSGNAEVSSESRSKENGGDAGTIVVAKTVRIEKDEDGSVVSIEPAEPARMIKLDNSAISTSGESSGGGRITVDANGSLYLLGSTIESNVSRGEDSGGDVRIGSGTRGTEFVIMNQSAIRANADEGDGGAIFIRTENFVKSSDSAVTATSNRGNDGSVRIEAPDLDISGGLTVLPGNVLDAARWMKKPCADRSGADVSRFIFKNRDAAPTPPDAVLASPPFGTEDRDGKPR